MLKKGTDDIWVFCDRRNERFFRFSLNVLAKACALAEVSGGKAVAVLLGASYAQPPVGECPRDGDEISMAQAGKEALSHGAHAVLAVENEHLDFPRADFFSSAMAQMVSERRPRVVLVTLNDFGRDMAARTAGILQVGLIADCADLRIDNGNLVAACPSWGGEIMAEIAFAEGQTTGLATVQPTIAKAEEKEGQSGEVEKVLVASLTITAGVHLIDREREVQDRQNLEQAEIIVVGGAGVGSADGFGQLRDLAATLGGEVGATRPPVLQHWVEEDRMIGQTGKTVRPKLLFSIGTSGAVQYTAGIMEADTIVAINRDGNAPIFTHADLGIVGDWSTIVPLLAGTLKKRLMRQLVDGLCEVDGKTEATSFGKRIAVLRQSQGWSHATLAQATDQSPEYIQNVENDTIAPPVSFLLRLARVLGVDPSTFLKAEEKAAIRDRRSEGFVKRTKSYSYQTLTPDAEAEHLRAFLVTIEPRQAHHPVAYKHEGEEFIYILSGELELTLGGKPYQLKKTESIRFNSDIPHKLKSLSDETTTCLVVLYSP